MPDTDYVQLTAQLIVFIGGLVGAVHVLRRQLREQTYLEYTGRYQRILDKLPFGALSGNFDVSRAKVDPVSWDRTLVVLNEYFDLSSEEFKLHGRGLVKGEVWDDWRQGILVTMGAPLCQEAWKEGALANSYTEMKEALAEAGVNIPPKTTP